MKRIILLGDSHLARLNRFEENSPAYTFQDELPDIEVVDLSSGGAFVADGHEQIQNYDLKEGDIVFVMFGTNDAAGWKQVPIEEFETIYADILSILSDKNVKTVVITPPPVNKEKQIPPGRSNETLNEYAEVAKKLAETYNLKTLDLYDLITEEMKTRDVHLDDGVHLNIDGYKMLIDEMKRFFILRSQS